MAENNKIRFYKETFGKEREQLMVMREKNKRGGVKENSKQTKKYDQAKRTETVKQPAKKKSCGYQTDTEPVTRRKRKMGNKSSLSPVGSISVFHANVWDAGGK